MKNGWPGLIMQVLGNHFRVVRFLLFSFVNAVVFCPAMFGRTSDIRLSILVGHTGTWARGNTRALGTWAHGHRPTPNKKTPTLQICLTKKVWFGPEQWGGGKGGLGESMKAFSFHAILSQAVGAPNQHLPGINWRLPWSGFIIINPQSRSIFACGY